jgi:hypothetical protein
MMRRILVVLSVLLAAPATAHAATLTNVGGKLTYTAAAGKTNNVAFSESPRGTILVQTTAGDNDAITATGCSFGGGAYLCAGVSSLAASAGDGDDSLDASALLSPATLDGGDGDDVLTGGAGDDTLRGGAGDDTFNASAGADDLRGGDGIDTAELSGASLSVSLDDVADDGVAGQGENIHSDIEDVDVTGTGTTTLIGSEAGNGLTVVGGKAVITGGPGADILNGGAGDDTIDARDGWPDRVNCGLGVDTVTADQFDQVRSDCEHVTTTPVVGGADDRPPSLAWSSPTAGADLAADAPTTLAVTAADDHGITHVQFYDDDRLVCDDTAAPYTCAYSPRGTDVGRDTLIARAYDTADQSTSAIQAVQVGRFTAKSLSLKLAPSRDRTAPYRFLATGKLTLPDPVSRSEGCAGAQVSLTAKAGSKAISTRHATLSRQCEYKLRLTFAHKRGSKLRISARFAGNAVMKPKSAATRTVRTG